MNSEGVIHFSRITPSLISIILQMIRKPNSIIVKYFWSDSFLHLLSEKFSFSSGHKGKYITFISSLSFHANVQSWTYLIPSSTIFPPVPSPEQCVVPENIHTPPTEGNGNSWGVRGSQRPKKLSTCSLTGISREVGESKEKSLPWGRYG